MRAAEKPRDTRGFTSGYPGSVRAAEKSDIADAPKPTAVACVQQQSTFARKALSRPEEGAAEKAPVRFFAAEEGKIAHMQQRSSQTSRPARSARF